MCVWVFAWPLTPPGKPVPRFLVSYGLAENKDEFGGGPPSIKSKIIHVINAVRTLMRSVLRALPACCMTFSNGVGDCCSECVECGDGGCRCGKCGGGGGNGGGGKCGKCGGGGECGDGGGSCGGGGGVRVRVVVLAAVVVVVVVYVWVVYEWWWQRQQQRCPLVHNQRVLCQRQTLADMHSTPLAIILAIRPIAVPLIFINAVTIIYLVLLG
jgi:hypothetical protein